jgi:hypothetical protein
MTRTHTRLAGHGPDAARSRTPGPDPAWPESRLLYCNGAYDLVLRAGRREAKAALEGEPEFALVVEEPLVLLGYRFGQGRPWALAPFAWQDRPRHEQTPPLDSDDRALLAVELCEPGEDRPHAARNVTLSLEFSRALNDAVRERARQGTDPREADLALRSLRRRFREPQGLLARAVARSAGSP